MRLNALQYIPDLGVLMLRPFHEVFQSGARVTDLKLPDNVFKTSLVAWECQCMYVINYMTMPVH